MSQPLPENGPPRIQRKFKIDAEEPSEDSRTERPTPKVRAGLPQRGTKNMRHGNLKIVEEEFKIVQYLTLPGTKQNFQGKTTTVTAQGRSSRTATQPRKKNIRKRKHAKTENMRRKKTCEERKHAKKKTCEPLMSRRVEPRTTRATRRTRQKPPGEISTRAPRRNPAR